MPPSKQQLPGLNIYRAVAVIMMILAHAARVQSNMSALHAHPADAGIFDWPFVASLIVEPIISALFLFIAGFSLVLSLQNAKESTRDWIIRLGKRMGTLFMISVVFAIAEQGVQWPGVLVSSGVLGIIAVGIFTCALALISPRPTAVLVGLTLLGIGITYVVDSARLSIIGLNAGAGGMLPLAVLAYLGALTGIVYQYRQFNGLFILFIAALVIGVPALLDATPWITMPDTELHFYPGNRIEAVFNSLKDAAGLYDGRVFVRPVFYWNHSWIFPARAMPILILGLILFLSVFKTINNRALQFLDWMGRQALNLYILHLILLAVVEVSGIKPQSGWQTLLIVGLILVTAPYLLRRISFVPFWIGLRSKQ